LHVKDEILYKLSKSIKTEKERAARGGASEEVLLAMPFRLLEDLGNAFSASSSHTNLMKKC